MPTVHRARSVFLGLGLAAALLLSTAGPAAAGPGETPQASWAANGPLRHFADWLLGLWTVGCTFDPGGGCGTGATTPPATGTEGLDVGCTGDPNGGCASGGIAPPQDDPTAAGCVADPNGGSCHG